MKPKTIAKLLSLGLIGLGLNALAGEVPKLTAFSVEDVSEPNKPLVDFIATYEGEIEDIRKLSLHFEVWTARTFVYYDTKDTAIFSEQGEGTNWVVRYRWEAYKVMPEDFHYDSVVVTFVGEYPYGGVQLWENGPYWMETNVGASKPEESGYFFQWGDTIGYRRENGRWVASDGSSNDWSFNDEVWLTYEKSIEELTEMGIIEEFKYATRRLTFDYDPVRVHCGGPWRLPLMQEFVDLDNNADENWTEHDRVNGFEMRGKGPYAERILFFPAAGKGLLKDLRSEGKYAAVWSTTPDGLDAGGMHDSYILKWFYNPELPGGLTADVGDRRYHAVPVRAVRSWDSGRVEAELTVFSLDARFTKTTEIPVAYQWLNDRYWDMENADDAAHEARAKEMAANGVNKVYECYLMGIDPTDANAKLELELEKKAESLVFSWTPDLNGGLKRRQYTVMARERMDMGEWEDIAVAWNGAMSTWGKFFRLKVEPAPAEEKRCVTSGQECAICEHETVVLWEGGPEWSTHNIGAKEPWDYGHYFQFGDPVGNKWVDDGDGKWHWERLDMKGGRFAFTPETCKTYDILGLENLEKTGIIKMVGEEGYLTPECDPATVNWGKDWRTPKWEDYEALMEHCDMKIAAFNGHYGLFFLGRGDYSTKHIFFPLNGWGKGDGLVDDGRYGAYLDAMAYQGPQPRAYAEYVNNSGQGSLCRVYSYDRECGVAVRPIKILPKD